MGKIIGIDLGSTNSCVAIMENGKATVVVNEEGSRTTPSVIALKDGDRKVGTSAKRQQIVNPKETVILIKRFMGATYDESTEAINHVQYEVVNKGGFPMVKIEGREYSAEELSSMIVNKMKKVAEDYLGTEVKEAVITVPAYFNDSARQATKIAGELAGLDVKRVIAEPTAALLASNIDMKKGGKFAVADFGGATTDFSIADISDSLVEILATNGDVYCGGSDIDKIVADYIVDKFKSENGVDLSTDAQAYARIYEASEKAKCELSSSASTEISLPYITIKDGAPIHLNETLTRAKFEQLATPIIDKVIACGKEAIKESKITTNDLDGILLVGGSCRIPLVQERLEKEFGVKLIKNVNLDEAVALGAAVQGSIINRENEDDILLLDVIPLSLGIETMGSSETMGGVMTKLVEANTTIPCKKTQTFSTAVDNQPSVTIRCLQGERPMAKDNKEIGVFNLDGIAPARRGVPQIEVSFDIDVNGILKVSAVDKATGKEQHITIENKGSLTQEDIDRIKADAEAHKAEDDKKREELEKLNKVSSIRYAIENTLENYKDKPEYLTEEDKAYFNEKLEVLKKMEEDKDFSNLDALDKEVSAKWNAIAVKAYGTNGNGFDFGDLFKGGFNPNAGGAPNSAKPNDETPNGSKDDFEEV